ncbi:hypothetical protein F1640_11860 [Novosphingobium sp. NBM11]|uniref:hypothetical protein n=1 Tax=Novosphingobium sp. NBM11 TaxID=2596914 RepID=UPI0018923926|nr:hypothetical protein [Novosphingobium sp. NBM11]MBF5090696.1 hypothetical protein [Novosphingobium sp. NBM11]
MNASSSSLKRLHLYVAPAVAAASYFSVLLQAKYDEGWADAMGCHRDKGCRLGEFSHLEYGILGALVISSFVLVSGGRGRWGISLAVALTLLNGALWIGMTR